jgi:predicted ester cyclase
MSTAELLQQWYEEVWNKGNEAFIDEKLDRDSISHGLDPQGTVKGMDHFKIFYRNFRQSFPSINITTTPLVHDDECAALYCHVHGRDTNGKEVSFHGISAARIKNGKFVESWSHFDFLKMYQQLGHILVAQIEDRSTK